MGVCFPNEFSLSLSLSLSLSHSVFLKLIQLLFLIDFFPNCHWHFFFFSKWLYFREIIFSSSIFIHSPSLSPFFPFSCLFFSFFFGQRSRRDFCLSFRHSPC